MLMPHSAQDESAHGGHRGGSSGCGRGRRSRTIRADSRRREQIIGAPATRRCGQPQTSGGCARSHPTGLLVWGESLFATEFRRDRVLVASTARAAKREGSKKFAKGWTVFADRGRHCATTRGKVRCARLDGAWGLASHAARGLLFVSSFGSDEVLAFSEGGDFKYALTGDLDCPEGLALNGDQLYVASFLDSRIVAFDLSTKRGRTLALGPPVGVDYETLAFVPAAFDELSARAARQRAAEIWNEESESAPFVDRLRGPEQLVVIGNATLAVSRFTMIPS